MQIHLFQNLGLSIVLDVESGSVHIVDDVVYDALCAASSCNDVDPRTLWADRSLEDHTRIRAELSKTYTTEEIDEALADIQELITTGQLYADEEYETPLETFSERETVVKALCLHVAHDCNLACGYCFAGEGEYHGERGLMDAETGKKALDFLVASSGNRTNLEVDFFGGEPLLALDTVKEVVAYGRSLEEAHHKKFRFTLTTNGVLLDDAFAAFANRELANVVLSIDGRKEVHDRMRPFPGGAGSFDTVLPKFRAFAKARGDRQYYLRGTYTAYNTDFAKDVLYLADLGFDMLSVEPAVTTEDVPWAIRKEHIPTLLAQYDLLAEEMRKRQKEGRGFTFFHFMLDLSGGPCVYKRLAGCGSGTEYLSVTPSGELYPCHQFAGEKAFLLGTLEEGIVRHDLVEEFRKVNVLAKEECRTCFARFYCSGGCAANGYHMTGHITGTDDIGCALMRKRVECAIALQAAMAVEQ